MSSAFQVVDLLEAGYRVIELQPGSKRPKAGPDGSWSECSPDMLVEGCGIQVGETRDPAWELVVLDVDYPDKAPAWLDRYEPTVTTGSGKEHYFFKVPAGRSVRRVMQRVLGFADLIGNASRGYVVAPPSTHPDTGQRYRWRFNAPPEVQKLPEAPRELYDLGAAGAHQTPAGVPVDLKSLRDSVFVERDWRDKYLQDIITAVAEGLRQGSRNDGLWAFTVACKQLGFSQYVAESLGLVALAQQDVSDGDGVDPSDFGWMIARVYNDPDESDVVAARAAGGLSLLDLYNDDSPPRPSLVPGFLKEGLIVISANPGVGKSSLVLEIGMCLAAGYPFLGVQVERARKVDLLMYEDSDEITKVRLKEWFPKDLVEAANQNVTLWTEHLPTGGVPVSEFIRARHEEEGVDVFVIDTLQESRGMDVEGKGNAYQIDTMYLGQFREMVRELGISVIFTHHNNKDGKFSGSQAIKGVPDIMWELTGKATEYVKVNPSKVRVAHVATERFYLQPENGAGRWALLDPEDMEDDDSKIVDLMPSEEAVLNVLRISGESVAHADLYDALRGKIAEKTIRNAASRLVEKGIAQRIAPGVYRLAAPPANIDNPHDI